PLIELRRLCRWVTHTLDLGRGRGKWRRQRRSRDYSEAGGSSMTERGGTLLGSIQRAITLVDMVANAPRPLPVKALASSAGLSLGTTYNIVRTLVHEGYLAREPDGLVLGKRFPSL